MYTTQQHFLRYYLGVLKNFFLKFYLVVYSFRSPVLSIGTGREEGELASFGVGCLSFV